MAQVWNERLHTAFPDGTPTTTLEDQLQASKFAIASSHDNASRSRSDLFKGCGATLGAMGCRR